MFRSKSLRAGVALASLIGVAAISATAAGASRVVPRSHPAPSPVGTYLLTTTIAGDPVTLEIEPNGGFSTTTDSCETRGNWVSQGSSFTFFVVDFQVCTANLLKYQDLFIGTIAKSGLNSASKPGPSAPYGDPWFAVMTDGTSAAMRSRASGGSAAPKVNVTPMGTYDEILSNGGRNAITFGPNSNFTASNGDTGYWITDGKSLALGVTSSTVGDRDCLFLGTIHGKSINSKHKQGPSHCDTNIGTWYAKKATHK